MKNITRLFALFIAGAGVAQFATAHAQTWIQTSAPHQIWQGVGSSADGSKLVAVASAGPGTPGPIYTSTNSGTTWTLSSAPIVGWSFVASSADGTHLAAVAFQDGIYTSTNAGTTWIKTSAPDEGWFSIASSADGNKLVATIGAGGLGGFFPIYASTNAGATWTQTSAPLLDWTSVACSADGTKLVAGAGFGPNGIYVSTNSGDTWSLATNLPTANLPVGMGYMYVASSTDGMKLVAVTQNAGIYTSTNSGLSWSPTTAPTNLVYRSVASSWDGRHLATVAESENGVYISTDSGATWTASGSPSTPNGGRVAFSADGSKLVASLTFGGIYVYESSPTPPTPTPPSVTAQPQSVTVNAHENASFDVTASGDMPLNYQWSLNGTNVADATSSRLTVSNVTQYALGAYAVIVANGSGSITSSNAFLSMRPYIHKAFVGAITYWGKEGSFSVEAWGTGPLRYQWFQNGAAVINATNQTLSIPSMQFTNDGLYSVVVSSALGSVTNTPAEVVVNPAGVSLGMFPGVFVTGVVGYTYSIQATSDLTNTNSWTTVATLTLMQPVQLWVDTRVDALSPSNPHKYYKVVAGY